MAVTALRLKRRAMACEFEVILQGEDQGYLEDVASLVMDEVQRLDRQLSCFDPASEVSYLNSEAANRAVIVEPGLFSLLELAKRVWEDTGGAFDVTSGPVIELWRKAEQEGCEPGREAIDTALARVGMSHVILDEESNSVRFDAEGVRINLGAIGKGFAVRHAADILREYKVSSGLISAGRSTICAVGEGPDSDGWKIGIRHPSRFDQRVHTVTLRDNAISTSGGVAQQDEVVVEKFEHIIDPTTGMPAQPTAVSVTVIMEDAALSDALSTAFYLSGKGLAECYCGTHAGVGALFVEQKDSDLAVFRVGEISRYQGMRDETGR